MATYLALNAAVTLACLVPAVIIYRQRLLRRRWLWPLAVLLVLTAVFDSLIILSDIVDYNPRLISGIVIGAAPIEDFAYAIVLPYRHGSL